MPMPPSVNGAYINLKRGGRALSKEAKDWKSEAVWRIKAQHPEHIPGLVVIILGFERSQKMHSADVDNRCKLALDALVIAGVIADDRHVIGLAASWLPPSSGLAHCLIVPAGPLAITFTPSQDGAAAGGFYLAPSPTERDTNGN